MAGQPFVALSHHIIVAWLSNMENREEKRGCCREQRKGKETGCERKRKGETIAVNMQFGYQSQ